MHSSLHYGYKISWFRLEENSGAHFIWLLPESRANCDVRSRPRIRLGCSGLCLIKCWIPVWTKTPQLLYEDCENLSSGLIRISHAATCIPLLLICCCAPPRRGWLPLGSQLLLFRVLLVPHTPAPKHVGGPSLYSCHFEHFCCTGDVQVAFIVRRARCW